MVLENYKPRLRDMSRVIEGKAREFNVTPDDLSSDIQVLTLLFAAAFDNDFIAPSQRLDIEKRLDEAFDEVIRDKESEARLERLRPEVRENRIGNVITMGVAASLIGAVTAMMYTLTKAEFSPVTADVFSLKLLTPAIGAFVASLAAVAAISVLKRTREMAGDIGSHRAMLEEGTSLMKDVAKVLRKHKFPYQIQPQIGEFRPDFLIESQGRKTAIEIIVANRTPSIHFLARIQDHLRNVLKRGEIEEVLVVSRSPLPVAMGISDKDHIRFVSLKELDSYLQGKNNESV